MKIIQENYPLTVDAITFEQNKHTREEMLSELNDMRSGMIKHINDISSMIERVEDAPYDRWHTGVEEAACAVIDKMYERATAACEGSHNMGESEYVQSVYVNGELYEVTVTFEYNRHDKQFYYVDGSSYSIKKVE